MRRVNDDPVADLDPAPAEIGDLLIRMTKLEWPTTEEERLSYFAALGLRDGERLPPHDDDPETSPIRFTTAIAGVDGIGSVFRDEFLGVSLFGYNKPVADSPTARAGYAALKTQLSDELGPPVEEWGSDSEPACLWRPGPLLLEMHCFQRHGSGIMVSPSHAERSAANDAAAVGRPV